MMNDLFVGMRGKAEMTVAEKDTAQAVASGALPVFATPVMILFAEKACADSVRPYLGEGFSTVGSVVNISHLAPTPAGVKVRCETELTEIDGRRLVFAVHIYDEFELIGDGTHERFIVQNSLFLEKLSRKELRGFAKLVTYFINPTIVHKAMEYGESHFYLPGQFKKENLSLCSRTDPEYPKKYEGCSVIPYEEIGEDCYFGRFDLVFSSFALCDLNDSLDEMMKLRRLIVKGGRILVAEKASPAMEAKILRYMKSCGFTGISVDNVDNILLICGKK